jgi:xylulokinase
MRLTSQAVGPKILWLKQHEPEIYQAAHKFLTATSYVIFKLTGDYVIERHTATEFNPLINIHTNEWDEKFAGGITPLEKLPRLGWSDEIAGQVTAEAARQTGIPQGTPVTFGAVDALSEAISVGVAHPGELMIMYGSTAFFILVIEKPIPSEELWMDMGAFKGTYVYAAGLSTSGSATTWFRDQFARDLVQQEKEGGENAYAVLAREAAASPAGANGLLMLPYLSGERTPIFDTRARGIFAGWASTTRAAICTAPCWKAPLTPSATTWKPCKPPARPSSTAWLWAAARKTTCGCKWSATFPAFRSSCRKRPSALPMAMRIWPVWQLEQWMD